MVLKCPVCGREFKTLYNLKTHVLQRHPPDQYCPVCRKKFSNVLVHLAHEARKGDFKHAVYYVLYHINHGHRPPETYKRYVPIVVKVLERGKVRL